MQKLQMDDLLESISKVLQEYAYNDKLESMHFEQYKGADVRPQVKLVGLAARVKCLLGS